MTINLSSYVSIYRSIHLLSIINISIYLLTYLFPKQGGGGGGGGVMSASSAVKPSYRDPTTAPLRYKQNTPPPFRSEAAL